MALALALLGVACTRLAGADDLVRTVQVLETTHGIRFGIWGNPPSTPAPTLIILANTIEGTLGDPYFRQSGTSLASNGFLCASIDLPCHGQLRRAQEPLELVGWRSRCERGEDVVAESNARLGEVLDHLVAAGYTDAARVAVCGTSRGGFLALHFAAADDRARCAAAFAPVTDLAALREFRGAETNALVRDLALAAQADALAGRPVWIVIGDQDTRVGTDRAIDLAHRIGRAARSQGLENRVELHVVPEPRGHTTPDGAIDQAAEWIQRQLMIGIPK